MERWCTWVQHMFSLLLTLLLLLHLVATCHSKWDQANFGQNGLYCSSAPQLVDRNMSTWWKNHQPAFTLCCCLITAVIRCFMKILKNNLSEFFIVYTWCEKRLLSQNVCAFIIFPMERKDVMSSRWRYASCEEARCVHTVQKAVEAKSVCQNEHQGEEGHQNNPAPESKCVSCVCWKQKWSSFTIISDNYKQKILHLWSWNKQKMRWLSIQL